MGSEDEETQDGSGGDGSSPDRSGRASRRRSPDRVGSYDPHGHSNGQQPLGEDEPDELTSPGRRESRRRYRRFTGGRDPADEIARQARKITRDSLLFTVGLVGICAIGIDSIVYEQAPDPLLVALFGSMVGLPVFLNVDEKKKGGE